MKALYNQLPTAQQYAYAKTVKQLLLPALNQVIKF